MPRLQQIQVMKFTLRHVTMLLMLCALLHLIACGRETRNSLPPAAAMQDSLIVDSSISSLDDALAGSEVPADIKAHLSLVDVRYYSFDKKVHQGQLVIRADLKDEIVQIFDELERYRFPIAKVIPISKYKFSDEASMMDNNTSAFNYRTIQDTSKLSNHALGRALDINPWLNPSVRNGIADPPGAKYDPAAAGTIIVDGVVVRAFRKRGWSWGGDWKSLKDYQHFEKPDARKS